jgi:hypothetical protein
VVESENARASQLAGARPSEHGRFDQVTDRACGMVEEGAPLAAI